MCGIIAYAGHRPAEPILIEGLKRLEYRGYDGFGYLVSKQGSWSIVREGPKALRDFQLTGLKGNLGIGHTRWATHGKASPANTHPILCGQKKYYSVKPKLVINETTTLRQIGMVETLTDPKVAIVHNGTLDNYIELKTQLQNSYSIVTETDTEVMGHYLEDLHRVSSYRNVSTSTIHDIFRPMFKAFRGEFAIAFVHEAFPEYVILASRGSPLLVSKCGYAASDINALSGYATTACRLQDEDIVIMSSSGIVHLFGKDGSDLNNRHFEQIPEDISNVILSDYPHYMLKEIHQQPSILRQKLEIPSYKECPKKAFLFGCGSSWHAALIGRYYLERLAAIPAEVEYASEMTDRFIDELQPEETLFVALTQSGETKDTIRALRKLKDRNTLVVTNTPGSQADKMTRQHIYTNAGLEIGVAATKSFTQQLATLLCLANSLSISSKIMKTNLDTLIHTELPNRIEEVLASSWMIKQLAPDIAKYNHILYLASGINYPLALEGALKMKEVAYIHAEAMPAAEMKHGPIALIDDKTLSIFICTQQLDSDSTDIMHNMSEIKARGGLVFAITDTASWGWVSKYADYFFVTSNTSQIVQPILMSLPLQLLAYYVAAHKGLDVDRPRNLAKSVTV